MKIEIIPLNFIKDNNQTQDIQLGQSSYFPTQSQLESS